MAVPLEKSLKRELRVGKQSYTLTISPRNLTLVPKGRRKGIELQWAELVSGDAAMAVALNASLEQVDVQKKKSQLKRVQSNRRRTRRP